MGDRLGLFTLSWLHVWSIRIQCAVFVNPADFAGNVLANTMDCCRIRVFSLRGDIGLISSGDVKSLRRKNVQMNEVYSQVAYEMIEIWPVL